ncbi:hypothetical protein HELRODRAFT_158855 [Helobdella robusta]|uniref:PHD-type domain-containing protein n=1 Tax=Helobdella robusta TaxID=6412 RepID=T1ENC3_HELRO|nr:hypothetical protein HELRODRAFT_158855 [Helobdella robusta]ESO12349.1 hypothetical protein HELRODRAFT_158855 [Helobdella robusta]
MIDYIKLIRKRNLGFIGPRISMHVGKNFIEGRTFLYFFIFSSAGCGQTTFLTCEIYVAFRKGAKNRNVSRQTSSGYPRGKGTTIGALTIEPSGISAHDGRRPDGCTLIPWRAGRCLAWDVTVPGTLAERYVNLTSKECGLAAARAADEKMKKYGSALPSMEFLPICIEVLGPMDPNTLKFLKEIGKRISVRSEAKGQGKAVKCSQCEYFAHANCVSIPEEVCNLLDSSTNLRWFCDRCSSLGPNIKKLTSSVDSLRKDVFNKLNTLNDLNANIKSELENINAVIESNKEKLNQLESSDVFRCKLNILKE